MQIKSNDDLLNFLINEAQGKKDWFGFAQQRITAVSLSHEIAKRHADKLSPDQVVDYAIALNDAIYHKILRYNKRGNNE